MLLVDSLYINNSGGKVLLDFLVEQLELSGLKPFYLFDDRNRNDFQTIPAERKLYLKASLRKRHSFYIQNSDRFSKVFCFGNLAPTIRLKIPVYVYFHQRIFLSVPKDFSKKEKFIFKIKSLLFRKLLKNADYILLQTESIKTEFLQKIKKINKTKIKVIPFYSHLDYLHSEKIKNTFLYVSGGVSHKNHDLLIDAFISFYNHCKQGELILTISRDFEILYNRIENLKALGYPITNLGFIPKQELEIQYSRSEYLVYPSLSESFGLGIIEGLEAGCKIIGANLSYMHAVCNPSLLFDPRSAKELEECLKLAVTTDVKRSHQKVYNEIDQLIELLK